MYVEDQVALNRVLDNNFPAIKRNMENMGLRAGDDIEALASLMEIARSGDANAPQYIAQALSVPVNIEGLSSEERTAIFGAEAQGVYASGGDELRVIPMQSLQPVEPIWGNGWFDENYGDSSPADLPSDNESGINWGDVLTSNLPGIIDILGSFGNGGNQPQPTYPFPQQPQQSSTDWRTIFTWLAVIVLLAVVGVVAVRTVSK